MSSIIMVDFSYIVSELCLFDIFVAILYSIHVRFITH